MFGYSSTYGVGSNIEEYEPLGQQISLTDPASDEELPITAPLPIGSASEPEWQCQIPQAFYGGFEGMPFHCQWADIKRRAFEGEQLWKFEFEENPHKIDGGAKAAARNNPSVESQAVNLTATDKPETEAAGGSPVAPASLPSADGTSIDFKQQINDGQVSFDESAGVGTTVNAIDDSIPGFVGADDDNFVTVAPEDGRISDTGITQRRLGCVFNINLERIPKEWKNTDYSRMVPDTLIKGEMAPEYGILFLLKKEITRIGSF